MGESERYIGYSRRKITFGCGWQCIDAFLSVSMQFSLSPAGSIEIIYYMIQSAPGSFESNMLPWFIMPAKLSALAIKPWTVLTNMFMHTRLITFITNMMWLWAFGAILQSITGNRKIIPVYIIWRVGRAVAFIAANYLMPSLSLGISTAFLYGATPATMAIAVATTALAPDYRFFRMLNGGIPIWILTLLYVIIDFAGISGGSAAYNISHLAGAFTGFMFVFSIRKGVDWSVWMNNLYDWFMNLFNPA